MLRSSQHWSQTPKVHTLSAHYQIISEVEPHYYSTVWLDMVTFSLVFQDLIFFKHVTCIILYKSSHIYTGFETFRD